MATLEQRIQALEQVHQNRAGGNAQHEKDIRTAYAYFNANGGRFDLLPPDYFSAGERTALETVIKLEREV